MITLFFRRANGADHWEEGETVQNLHTGWVRGLSPKKEKDRDKYIYYAHTVDTTLLYTNTPTCNKLFCCEDTLQHLTRMLTTA